MTLAALPTSDADLAGMDRAGLLAELARLDAEAIVREAAYTSVVWQGREPSVVATLRTGGRVAALVRALRAEPNPSRRRIYLLDAARSWGRLRRGGALGPFARDVLAALAERHAPGAHDAIVDRFDRSGGMS